MRNNSDAVFRLLESDEVISKEINSRAEKERALRLKLQENPTLTTESVLS